VSSLFDVLADGSDRAYFDILSGAGVATATANAQVSITCSAQGVLLGVATAINIWTASAAPVGGTIAGTASATVEITAANVPNQTLVYIPPAVATVEIFGSAGSGLKTGRAIASVAITAQAVPVTPWTQAQAAIAITARAQSLVFGIASASVVVSATADGSAEDISTSPAHAELSITASARPVKLGNANAVVSISGTSVAIGTVIGVARAAVTISATAAESAGFIDFPSAEATITITARAVGNVIAAPVHATIPVTGKTIDWKTIVDTYNSQQAPVAEYEFGYGKARRTFRRNGT
jgi:hypothetical protein